MEIRLDKVAFADKPVLHNMLQLCMYESSAYDGYELTEHGQYRFAHLDHYWTEQGRHPFFIRVNGKLAGLALVRTIYGVTQPETVYSLGEFFVMRKYQGKGVGRRAACMLFDLFQGKWQISETKRNVPAQNFWRKVVGEYTKGVFREEVLPDQDYGEWMSGPTQLFTTAGKTLVYLVRHAQSPYTPDEVGRPLSPRGMHDAEQLAKHLEYEQLDAIYASPYRRAVQTVEPLAKQIGKEIVIVPDFRERLLAAGDLDFDQAVLRTWKDFNFAYPSGETNAQASARGVAALQGVLRAHPGGRVAIGTHGTLMALIMGHYDPKRYDYKFWQQLEMPDAYVLVFEGEDFCFATKAWARMWS